MLLLHPLSALLASLMTSEGLPIGKVVDLTYDLDDDSVFWPGQPMFNVTILHRRYKASYDSWLENNYFCTPEHGGTHIDSPSHFAEGKWRTHEIPPSNLIGPGVVIDVTDKVKVKEDYAVTVEDLKNWEENYGKIPSGAVVVMRSGWGERFPDRKRVFNTDNPSDPTTFRFPGFHEDAARWLAEERDVIAVGSETPSPDVGGSRNMPVHKILNGKNIVVIENLAHAEKLPPAGSTIIIGVMKLRDGSGGHARILGMIDAGSAGLRETNVLTLLLLLTAALHQSF